MNAAMRFCPRWIRASQYDLAPQGASEQELIRGESVAESLTGSLARMFLAGAVAGEDPWCDCHHADFAAPRSAVSLSPSSAISEFRAADVVEVRAPPGSGPEGCDAHGQTLAGAQPNKTNPPRTRLLALTAVCACRAQTATASSGGDGTFFGG
jgi:hypothetical protein